MKKIIFLLTILLIPLSVNAEKIYEFDTPSSLCSAIANETLTVNLYSQSEYTDTTYNNQDLTYYGIKKIDNHNFQMLSNTKSNCSNYTYRDRFLTGDSVGIYPDDDYPPWVFIGRKNSSFTVYINDIEADKSEYSYIRIGNSMKGYNETSGRLLWTKTLKTDEKVYLKLNTNDLVKMNNNEDLRLTMSIGVTDSDIDVTQFNSVAYYAYDTSGTKYGPYRIDYSTIDKIVSLNSSKMTIYKIVSENLFKNIDNNISIAKIVIVPYEYYRLYSDGGEFKIFNLSLDKYDSMYYGINETVYVNDAENIIRHRIVDNRMTQGLVKWRASDDATKEMSVYYNQKRKKVVFDSSKVYYGMPYTTVKLFKSTFDSFMNQMTYSNGEYAYHISDTYKKNEYSMRGYANKESISTPVFHNKGDLIERDSDGVLRLNVINQSGTLESNMNSFQSPKICGSSEDLKDSSKDFVMNSGKYVYGVSCTSSISASVNDEIPVNYISSELFTRSNNTELVGGLDLTTQEVEEALRCNNVISKDNNITPTNFKVYYSSVIKGKYGSQAIYNAYGLSVPGDIISHSGHARFVSGYSYVICNDKTIFPSGYYTDNACSNHGGINPNESYVITTEGGTGFVERSELKDSHVLTSNTGWGPYTIDQRYTDIDESKIDSIFEENSGIVTTFRPNLKYSFADLYGAVASDSDTGDDDECENEECENETLTDEESHIDGCIAVKKEKSMYLPYRYRALSKISETSRVEVPNVRLFLEKEYTNDELYDYIKEYRKLRGTIISNYQIAAIKFEINGDNYFIYPAQSKTYSLYTGLDSNILEALNQDITSLRISVKSGPVTLSQVQDALGNKLDDDGYIEIVNIRHKYNVNYHLNNDIVSEISTICTYGLECTLSNTSFENDFPLKSNKWKFAGYSTSDKSTDITYNKNASFTYDLKNDLELYAIGKREFKFSTGIAPQKEPLLETQYWNTTAKTNEYYTSINVPLAEEINGWNFIGYRATNNASSSITINSAYAGNEYKPKVTYLTSVEFRSIYERNLTINYNNNGGTGNIDSSVEKQYYNSGIGNGTKNSGANVSNTTFTLSNGLELSKSGYFFAGWAESPNSTNILPITYNFSPNVDNLETSKTLYAIWYKDDFIKGDINMNGNIDLSDVIHILKRYLGIEYITNIDIKLGDFNNDGEIGLQDIIAILKAYLGIA